MGGLFTYSDGYDALLKACKERCWDLDALLGFKQGLDSLTITHKEKKGKHKGKYTVLSRAGSRGKQSYVSAGHNKSWFKRKKERNRWK